MEKHDIGLGLSGLSLGYEVEAIYFAVPDLTTLALVLAIASLLSFAATVWR